MNKKIENAKRILLKEDRFYDDDTEIKATKVLLEYIKELEQKKSILDKVTDKFSKMKQSIDKLKNRDGESMIMVDVCIQNIIAFYDDIEKIIEGEKK